MQASEQVTVFLLLAFLIAKLHNVSGFCPHIRSLAPINVPPSTSRNVFRRVDVSVVLNPGETAKDRRNPSPLRMMRTPSPGDGAPNAFVGLTQVPVKESLRQYGMDSVVADQPWLLTVISLLHYALFPLGLGLSWTLFSNSDKLGSILGTLPSHADASNADLTLSVFLLLMGHLLSPIGAAAALLMHEYEYWQVAELKDPKFEDNGKMSFSAFNNERLYTICITNLINALTFGSYLIAAAVFRVQDNPLLQGWGLLCLVGFYAGPDFPQFTTVVPELMERFGMGELWNSLTNGGRPIFPISSFKFCLNFINSILCIAALVQLFGSTSTPFADVPLLRSLPAAAVAPIPFIISSIGGIWEGIVAESRFDQRHHLVAVIMLSGGYFLFIPYYQNLLR